MPYDAFTAGVEPGGLRSQEQIRILLCYLLSSVDAPLRKEDILQSVQGAGLANYFEVTDALGDLCARGNLLRLQDGSYTASEQAREIARQLDTALPISVRDKAVRAALGLLAQARRAKENQVEIEENAGACFVHCHISGGPQELLSFTLTVPDRRQAELVRHNFQANPSHLYETLLALLTEEADEQAQA